MRIPFTLDTWLKDKSQKVETKDGRPSRILCWDRRGERSLVVLVQQPNGFDDVLFYYENGLADGVGQESDEDLFIVTEPEMSEWELAIAKYRPPTDSKETIQRIAAELLSIAKQQLLQSGELLTQEHHEKLMETQYKETLDGVKKNWHDYFTPQAVTDIYNAGRNDVLKGLPRWKKCDLNTFYNTKCNFVVNGIGRYLILDGYMIDVDRLEKLPGFKEDESHE